MSDQAVGSRARVVVIGGGFGGLAAVRGLRKAPVEVTLVDRTNHHLFQPLLYQVATGLLSPGEIAPPLRAIVRRQRNVRVRLGEVTDVDVPGRSVGMRGADGANHRLGYDYLVVAAGAGDSYFGHDDWASHLYPMKTLAQAVALRDQVLAVYERAADSDQPEQRARWTTFAIVGGGPTGVEVAGQLASMARQFQRDYRCLQTDRARIVLVEAGSDLLAAFAEPLRAHAQRKLTAMGVDIRLHTQAANVDEHGIDIQAGGRTEHVAAGTVVWAAGVRASSLAAMLGDVTGATVDHRGRVQVGADCSIPGHPELFAVGDMADVNDLPGMAEPAMQAGRYVAKLIARKDAGQPPPGPFHYWDLGSMATIAGDDAVADAFGLTLTGLPGKVAWATVHVAFLAGWGNRAGVLGRWAYELGSGNRSERAILEGAGADDVLGQLARSDEPRGPERSQQP